jgi:copper(I)-binding protein
MKRIWMLLMAGTLLLSSCVTNDSHMAGTGMEIRDPWVRSAIKDGNSAVYMLLYNHAAEDDALVGVSSDVAAAAEIHLSQMNPDGVMEMTQQDSIAILADNQVELKPGGYHIMLIGLKQDLIAGDEFILTLQFMHHEDIVLTVPVIDVADMGGMP